VIDLREPLASDGSVLVRTRLIGICGTDVEIAIDGYGVPPREEERLVLGHESLADVIEAPDGSGRVPGDLVVGVVRRPDPVPFAYFVRDRSGIDSHPPTPGSRRDSSDVRSHRMSASQVSV
jgi:NADPH:quinone reductase-like Zn-dependent oxidoreductase